MTRHPVPSATTAAAAVPSQMAMPRGGLRSFLRLISMLRPYRRHVAASLVIAWLVAGARLAVPYLTGVVIDDIHAGRQHDVPRDVALLVGAGALVALLNASRRLVSGTISLGLEQTLRERIFAHLSGLSFTFFDRHQTGQLLSRATSDVTQVRFFLGYGLTYAFVHTATIVAVPVVVVLISPRLAVVVLTMMAILFLVSLRYSRRSHPVLKELQQRTADVTAAAEENIVGARVVRAFGQEQREIERMRALADRVVEQERASFLLSARYRPLYGFIPNLALAVVVLLGAPLVARDQLTLGQFFAFYGYVLQLTGPVRIIGNLLGRAQRATASGERLWELLDTDERLPQRDEPLRLTPRKGAAPATATPATSSATTAATIPPPAAREVCFESVTFAYRDGRPVLDDVTLRVPAGATVALLGPTGCGKTTLTSLVPRFYDPDAGRVTVDGIDVRDLDVRELRREVGVVGQEPFLFSATVAENLRFGAPDATADALWAALETAQADGFVRDLPDGLDTQIGERGFSLSGGQRQRLAIARALVVDPGILILDDATASVDSSVEARITQALHSATRGRTTMLIAHRPSTIALASHIVIMDAGRIVDQGTHDELLARSETYRQVHEQRAARREFLLDPHAASTTGGAPA